MHKFWTISALILFRPLAAFAQDAASEEALIMALLDDFHEAAAQADVDRYLGHFTDNAVFIGTDEKERWPLMPEFTEYVVEGFASGGWSYYSINKNITFSRDGSVAWFDEISISNSNGGHFRGSGVLENFDGEWKIAHYVLSFVVYNEIWEQVLELNATERTNQQAN
jgi:hypothetical protein